MSQREYQETMKGLDAHQKKVTASPDAARAFLTRLGVLNKKGNVTTRYKHVCIPQSQD
jgi:hypothetical protein